MKAREIGKKIKQEIKDEKKFISFTELAEDFPDSQSCNKSAKSLDEILRTFFMSFQCEF